MAAGIAAIGPAVPERAAYKWPPKHLPEAAPTRFWTTPLLLARHTPASVVARVPCGRPRTLSSDAGSGVLLATMRDPAASNGLKVRRTAGVNRSRRRPHGSREVCESGISAGLRPGRQHCRAGMDSEAVRAQPGPRHVGCTADARRAHHEHRPEHATESRCHRLADSPGHEAERAPDLDAGRDRGSACRCRPPAPPPRRPVLSRPRQPALTAPDGFVGVSLFVWLGARARPVRRRLGARPSEQRPSLGRVFQLLRPVRRELPTADLVRMATAVRRWAFVLDRRRPHSRGRRTRCRLACSPASYASSATCLLEAMPRGGQRPQRSSSERSRSASPCGPSRSSRFWSSAYSRPVSAISKPLLRDH